MVRRLQTLLVALSNAREAVQGESKPRKAVGAWPTLSSVLVKP